MSDSSNIFLVAGEESANQYALKLIDEFSETNVKFSGVGYTSLQKKGFELVVDANDLSVMGGVEVFQKFRVLKQSFQKCLNYIKKEKPEVLFLIDFGGFNLRLAKAVKELGLKTKVIYFISPKFWAWRESRVKKVINYVDHMFVIHPFEVDFYQSHNYKNVTFVGHPLIQELKTEYENFDQVQALKESFQLPTDKKTLGVLLGSRNSEILKHKTPFLETVKKLLNKRKDLHALCIVPPSRNEEDFFKMIQEDLPQERFYVKKANDPMDLMALMDVGLVCSGTATLQAGLLKKPMAIGYIMNPITMWLAKRFVKGVKYAGLVNILSHKEVSKEFLQEEFQPEAVASYLDELLNFEDAYKEQKESLTLLKKELGDINPYERLKHELTSYL